MRDFDDVLAVDQRSFPRPWTRAMFCQELDRAEVSLMYVIRLAPDPDSGHRKADEALVGYCATWVILDELHIHNLAIDPPWRRLGAGRALLDHVLVDSARRGAHSATLEVRATNGAARQLYERAGFRVAAVRPNYYTHPPDDALIMWHRRL